MKNFSLKMTFCLVCSCLCLLVAACGDDGGSGEYGGNGGNGGNNVLVGTKWTTHNWDFSSGDDWATVTEERYDVYFCTPTEGIYYYGRKDNDSDFGSSRHNAAMPFEYRISGNRILLESLIDDPMPSAFEYLELKGGVIMSGEMFLKKGKIDREDKEWFATITGKTGTCTWFYDLIRTLWVYGDGEMADYSSFSQTPWAQHDRIGNEVWVDEGVTAIGAHAFANPSVGRAVLPNTLTRIGKGAFKGACFGKVSLPKSLGVVEDEAFCDCKNLTVYLPEGIEEIGDAAFYGCRQASLLSTPALRRIGASAFFNTKLTHWTNSQVLEEVGETAVTDCELQKLVLPNSLKRLGSFAFSANLLSSIHIGTGLEEVVGTPFDAATSGTVYVNKNTPVKLTHTLVDAYWIDRWTLVVPRGCRSAYASAAYWCNFRNIEESGELEGDGTVPEGNEGGGSNPDENGGNGDGDLTSKVVTYWLDGARYRFIRVEGGPTPNLYVMETELPHRSILRIGDEEFGPIDSNADDCVFKTEFRNFLSDLRARTGAPLRLMTFEEWKFIAAGGNESRGYLYSGSDNIDDVAWYEGNCSYSHRVAEKQPNELGFYDLCGNYEELVNNTGDIYFIDDRQCGGSWNDPSHACRVTSFREGQDSGRIPGTNYKHKNAYDSRYVAVRLAFDLPGQ